MRNETDYKPAGDWLCMDARTDGRTMRKRNAHGPSSETDGQRRIKVAEEI